MSKLTHDINGTCATLNLQAANIQKMLPNLIAGYQLAKQHNLLESPFQERQLELLQALVDGLSPEVSKLQKLMSDLQAS